MLETKQYHVKIILQTRKIKFSVNCCLRNLTKREREMRDGTTSVQGEWQHTLEGREKAKKVYPLGVQIDEF